MSWSRSVDEALQAMEARKIVVTVEEGAQIGDVGARRIAEALPQNVTLRSLHLASNNVGAEGAAHLAQALAAMAPGNALWGLSLQGNAVGDEGATALAQALTCNTVLGQLLLDSNGIGDIGAVKLAEALKCNRSLRWLGLEYNSISDIGARALCEALDSNGMLTNLDLGGNRHISQDLLAQIADKIKTNEERCVILQVQKRDDDQHVTVTMVTGEVLIDQLLQPETTLWDVQREVANLRRGFHMDQLRWILPGNRIVGRKRFGEPLLRLLEGGVADQQPGPFSVEANSTDEAGTN